MIDVRTVAMVPVGDGSEPGRRVNVGEGETGFAIRGRTQHVNLSKSGVEIRGLQRRLFARDARGAGDLHFNLELPEQRLTPVLYA